MCTLYMTSCDVKILHVNMTSINATIISSQYGGHQQSKRLHLNLHSRIKGIQEKESVMDVS